MGSSREPGNLEITLLMGELEQQQGNPANAYVAFRRASRQDPASLRAVSGLALSAEAPGFEQEAEAAYQRWQALEGPERAGH